MSTGLRNAARYWRVWLWGFVVVELLAIATKLQGGTLSEFFRREIRYHPVGRFAFWALIAWLLWHWGFRPREDTSISWRDGAFVAGGLLIAAIEAWRMR